VLKVGNLVRHGLAVGVAAGKVVIRGLAEQTPAMTIHEGAEVAEQADCGGGPKINVSGVSRSVITH
jgi:hypothetical protein